MLRRLMLCALALCALIALASCGLDRITGPQVVDARGSVAAPMDERTDDGGGGGGGGIDPTVEGGSAADTLRAGDDSSR